MPGDEGACGLTCPLIAAARIASPRGSGRWGAASGVLTGTAPAGSSAIALANVGQVLSANSWLELTTVVSLGAALTLAGAIVYWTAPADPVSIGTNGRLLFVRGRF